MIIRVKKRDLAVTGISLILILSIILALSVPLIYAQTVNTNFAVWLTISNRNPTNVSLINATGFGIDPVAGSDAAIRIVFNASDPDGAGDINGTLGGRVLVNLTLGSPSAAQFRTQTVCTNSSQSTSKHIVVFNCTVNMRYYDNNSAAWVINITVQDSSGGLQGMTALERVQTCSPTTRCLHFHLGQGAYQKAPA